MQEYTFIAMGKISNENNKDEVRPEPGVIGIVPVVAPAEGTSYLSVAKQYDVDLSKIFEFNEISRTEVSDKDQLIYLQRKRKTGNNEFHIVQPGETLHFIAQQQAIRLESLLELNWLKRDEKPAVGEKLSLKSKSSSMPKLTVNENYSLIPAANKQPVN